MAMTATQEKGGLERLVERGAISEVCCQDLRGEEIRGGYFELLPVIEVLDGMANELCDLLERRDRREGVDDNPPEIPAQIIDHLTSLSS